MSTHTYVYICVYIYIYIYIYIYVPLTEFKPSSLVLEWSGIIHEIQRLVTVMDGCLI
jgi:hypothetical protein